MEVLSVREFNYKEKEYIPVSFVMPLLLNLLLSASFLTLILDLPLVWGHQRTKECKGV